MAGCEDYGHDSVEGIDSSGSVLAFHPANADVTVPSWATILQLLANIPPHDFP